MQIDFNKFYKDKTILISGGGGYIGSSLTKALSQVDCTLKVVSSSSPSWLPNNCTANFSFIPGDISNLDFWLQHLNDIDYIFHLASLDGTEDYKREVEVNVTSTLHLLNSIVRKGISPQIIFTSSANIFGKVSKCPVNESCKDKPESIWSINKLMIEKYLDLYYRQFNINSISIRLPNVYGFPSNIKTANRVVINNAIFKALNGRSLSLYKNQNCLRDYIFIDDVVSALLSAGILNKQESKGQYYVIGSGEKKTISEAWNIIVNKSSEQSGVKVQINNKPNFNISSMEIRNFVADFSAFKAATGWESKVNFNKGIERTVSDIWSNLTNLSN